MTNKRFLSQEFRLAAYRAYSVIVPSSRDRIPVTWTSVPYMLVHFLPILFMAYLVRRPNTHLIRVLMLPTVIMALLHMSFGFAWVEPELNVYNWGLAYLGLVLFAKALEFAFVPAGRLKIGEKVPGEIEARPTSPGTDADKHPTPISQRRSTIPFLPVWFEDAVEVLCTARGIGWDFGKDLYIPKDPRPQQRTPFLRATLFSFLKSFLLLDFQESLLKLIPGVGSPYGGSIFNHDLPHLQRYALSTFAHFLTGSCLLVGFQMVYDLFTLIDVGIFQHSTYSWPPIMDNPWAVDSLHGFWAKRWHQIFRQTFLVFGGYPGKYIGGNLGMVIGVFMASGLYHEFGMYTMGHGLDHRVTIFFCLQGFMVIAERIWRKVTGKRVGGWWGRLWCYFVIMVLAQPCVDAWHERGLAGGRIIFPSISPTRRLLFPVIARLFNVERLRH